MKPGDKQAYPRPVTLNAYRREIPAYPGLTKRELFAAMAMQGLLATLVPGQNDPTDEVLASWSVHQADALLAELNKKTTND